MLHCYFCNGIHKWQLMEDQKIMLVYRTFILDRASCFWKPIFMSSLITGTQWNSRKHGHGARGATPASNAARRGHGGRRCWCIRPRLAMCFFFQPFRPKFKKRKEKVQNTPFELNNIPYFSSSAHFIQTPSSLTLSHSVTRLSLSLCSCLLASISALRLPCGCETLSQTATQSLQIPKFNSLSILWVVFNLWTSCFSYYLVLLLNLVYVYIMWKSMLSNILKI